MTSGRLSKGMIRLQVLALAGLMLIFGLLCGCREMGGGNSAGFGSLQSTGSSASTGLGLLAYNIYHTSLRNDGETAAVTVLEGRRTEFITAVDKILPQSVSSNLLGTIRDLVPLIQDGTLPDMGDDIRDVLVMLKQDDDVLQAIVDLSSGGTGGINHNGDGQNYYALLSRLLAYPDFEPLTDALSGIIEENDGVDANGTPNGEMDIINEFLATLAKTLKNLPDPNPNSGATTTSELIEVLLQETAQRDGVALGAPAWAVRYDGDLPQVATTANGDFLPPFVDLNNDQAIDVNANGEPVDLNGQVITLTAFGTDGNRDADGKAITAQSVEIFVYYDMKKTVLGTVGRVIGDILRTSVLSDQIAVMAGMPDPLLSGGYSADNPSIDQTFALYELMKADAASNLLQGFAALFESDPVFAELILTDVGSMVSSIQAAPITQPSTGSSGGGFTLDSLVPVLDQALEPTGTGPTPIRALLQAFSDQQQVLQNLPQGFAIMFRYHDVGAGTLTAPGLPSAFERLMELIEAAGNCGGGGALSFLGINSMAEFYLDSIAGNATLLGIPISVNLLHLILPYTANLFCSSLTQQHVAVLQDFDQSGALDAFRPVVKVFSDAGQTSLLTDILSGLGGGGNYGTSIRPLEDTIADVLESGAIEHFFDAFAKMNTIQIPGSSDVISDALADMIAILVEDDGIVTDRHGSTHMSLLHMLADAMEAVSDRQDLRGLDDESGRVTDKVVEILTETVTDAQGNVLLKNAWIVPLASAALKEIANAIPTDAAARLVYVQDLQQDGLASATSADTRRMHELLLAIDTSAHAPDVYTALANVFTPDTNPAHDVYGALLKVVGSSIGSGGSDLDSGALVKVLRFAGLVIDPAAGTLNDFVDGLQSLIAMADGQVLLSIIRNALDKGPNGDEDSPIEIVLDVIDEVSATVHPGPTPPLSVQSLKDSLDGVINFLEDQNSGLPMIWNQLQGTTP